MENAIDWTPILDFLLPLSPVIGYVFMGLGILVIVGTFIDRLIPDTKDKGFMKYVLNIPILGSLLTAMTRFSPFNIKE